jgi:hypothetical protein
MAYSGEMSSQVSKTAPFEGCLCQGVHLLLFLVLFAHSYNSSITLISMCTPTAPVLRDGALASPRAATDTKSLE